MLKGESHCTLSFLPVQSPFFLAWHGQNTDIQCEPTWNTYLSVRAGVWSGWINYTSLQGAVWGREKKRDTAEMNGLVVLLPCRAVAALWSAFLGHSSTRLSKRIHLNSWARRQVTFPLSSHPCSSCFECPRLCLLDSFTMAQRGVGNQPLPQEPANSFAQLHRNLSAFGAQAHVCKLLFSQCTHLEHTWFPAVLFLRSCREGGNGCTRHAVLWEQVGESSNESRKEGHDCKIDLLHGSPEKEVLLEVKRRKVNSWQVYKWVFYFNHKISVYAIALIGMAGQCYQWHLDQTSGCFWAYN